MSGNYKDFDGYLEKLRGDIYEQPSDPGHFQQAQAFLDWAMPLSDGTFVLDVGCGQGFCRPLFEGKGISWRGVTLGPDLVYCRGNGIPADGMDISFLGYPDNSFDLVFARHVLEHSPFPILTLMEWRRVCVGNLLVVVPAPEYWGYGGRNHYSVYNQEQWWHTFARAGWKVVHENKMTTSHKAFMDHYMPEVIDRSQLMFPGAPKDVEFWYVLEQTEEKID